eukprot:13632-Rhodomonas_salina.2
MGAVLPEEKRGGWGGVEREEGVLVYGRLGVLLCVADHRAGRGLVVERHAAAWLPVWLPVWLAVWLAA